MVGGNNILVTSIHRNDPLTWFELDQISTLKDANGLCILPVQLSDNHFYLQAKNSCPDPYAARYYQTAGYSLKHVNSGNCWHARDIPARDNTPIILNPTCDVPIAKFILSSSKYAQHKCQFRISRRLC